MVSIGGNAAACIRNRYSGGIPLAVRHADGSAAGQSHLTGRCDGCSFLIYRDNRTVSGLDRGPSRQLRRAIRCHNNLFPFRRSHGGIASLHHRSCDCAAFTYGTAVRQGNRRTAAALHSGTFREHQVSAAVSLQWKHRFRRHGNLQIIFHRHDTLGLSRCNMKFLHLAVYQQVHCIHGTVIRKQQRDLLFLALAAPVICRRNDCSPAAGIRPSILEHLDRLDRIIIHAI